VLTTDRSGALKSLMVEVNREREERKLPPIKHCFDCWHFSKSVEKDLWKAAKLKREEVFILFGQQFEIFLPQTGSLLF
jgi:hypothetical protein